MSVTLKQALDHPTLAAAEPLLRAGAARAAEAQVRWVHSSEVLEIAPLLLGGELLLSGGESLARASEAERQEYIAALSDKKIAGLAIETGSSLRSLPADLVSAAELHQLPLIELRRVVPFVTVAQAINSILVNESVSHLQRADQVSHLMALELARGVGLEQLLEVLAKEIHADATLTDVSGDTISQAIRPAGRREEQAQPFYILEVDIPIRGIVSARLRLDLRPDSDITLARVASERTVDILALALLKTRSPSLKDLAGAELIRGILDRSSAWRLPELCRAAGISASTPVIILVTRCRRAATQRGPVEQLLRQTAPSAVTYWDGDQLITLLSLGEKAPRAARKDIIGKLRTALVGEPVVIAVGPVATDIHAAGQSLHEAMTTLSLAPVGGGEDNLLDAEDVAIERLAFDKIDPESLDAFVEEQLGDLLRHDAQRNAHLLHTLEAWLRTGCNTTETARIIHLERQSLHARLQKIFELIGGDPRGTLRLAGLTLAVRVARNRTG